LLSQSEMSARYPNDFDTAVLTKAVRDRLNLTQERFAAQMGVSFSTVNRWENGHRQPLPVMLLRMRELLEKLGPEGSDLVHTYFSKSIS
jgi:putative transcriptional regulator